MFQRPTLHPAFVAAVVALLTCSDAARILSSAQNSQHGRPRRPEHPASEELARCVTHERLQACTCWKLQYTARSTSSLTAVRSRCAVYNQDNREKVARDEAKYEAEQKVLREKNRKAESEFRHAALLARVRGAPLVRHWPLHLAHLARLVIRISIAGQTTR